MFQESTLDELLYIYYLDIFKDHPLEAHRQADGEIQLTNTGDAFIDKWEQQMADGEEPDLSEAFSADEFARVQKARQKNNQRLDERGAGTIAGNVEMMERKAKSLGLPPSEPSSDSDFASAFSTFGKKLNKK